MMKELLQKVKQISLIENYDSPYQFHSKMNAAANDDTFSDDGKNDNFKDENDLPF